jgi:hypothetical protein
MGQWRWLFCTVSHQPSHFSSTELVTDLNIPLCGLSGGLAIMLLNLPTPAGTLRDKLSQMDWMCEKSSFQRCNKADLAVNFQWKFNDHCSNVLDNYCFDFWGHQFSLVISAYSCAARHWFSRTHRLHYI